MRNMNDEKPAPIDYSIDEYKDMLKVKGRCTLGNKTVYRVYVYTSDYAKRRDYCGLYIIEEYARTYVYGDIEKPIVMKFPLSSQHKSWFLTILYYFASKDPEWQATHVDDFVELKHITELIFCDTYRCYPTVLGLFPLTGNELKIAAQEALRRDVIDELYARFGATNITEYIIDKISAKSFYVSMQRPKFNKIKLLVFIPAENPAYHAIKVSKLQLLYKKLLPQLDTLLATNLKESDPNKDWMRYLGVTREKLREVVRRVLSRGYEEDEEWSLP